GIGRERQLFSRLDAFPFEKLRRNAGGHDPIEVRDSLGLDPFPFRLLLLFLKDELHLLGLLLAPELLLDRIGHDRWKANLPKEHRLRDDASPLDHLREKLESLSTDLVAFRGVERLRLVRGGDLADGRADLRHDRDFGVVGTDRAIDIRRLRGIDAEKKRALEIHRQAFLRRNLGRLLELLGLDIHLHDTRERKDQVHSRRQDVRRHAAEEVLDADVARRNDGDWVAEGNGDQERHDDQPRARAAAAGRRQTDIDELRHRTSLSLKEDYGPKSNRGQTAAHASRLELRIKTCGFADSSGLSYFLRPA